MKIKQIKAKERVSPNSGASAPPHAECFGTALSLAKVSSLVTKHKEIVENLEITWR